MRFYDREEQLESLREMRSLAYNGYSRMTVVTGRRRIGKTTLVQKAYEDEPFVYLFVGNKNEAVLCREFTKEFSEKTGIFTPTMTSFQEVFRFFMEEGRRHKFTLFFDEFQNFLEVNPHIYGDIQNWWDRLRKESHVNMVVSGSVHSLMDKLFKDNKEPLYGRQDAMIRLGAFPTVVMKQIMQENAPGFTPDDLLALYTYTGGIPKYVEYFVDLGATSAGKIIERICREDSPVIEEGRKLLAMEFGKKYTTYFSILQAISQGFDTQARIEDYLGGKSIGGHLLKLEETYSLIRKVRPIFSKPKTQTVRYEIGDIFLRFWFRYIEKNERLIELGQFKVLAGILQEDYETYSGDVLERFLRAKLAESLHYRDIGGWWDPKGFTDNKGNHQQCEIDIVAQRLDDDSLEIYEVKRNPKKYKEGLLEAKVEHFCLKVEECRKRKRVLGCLSLEDL